MLNRWLLEQDWCPLEPFAAAGPIAVDRRWARAGAVLPLRYVPLHHGREPPWEDFPPKGLRLLGVDDDAVVVGDARAAAGGRDAAARGRELDPVAVGGWTGARWSRSPPLGRSPLGPIAAGPEPDVGEPLGST